VNRLPELPSAPRQAREHVLGIPVDVLGWNEAIDRIFAWARERQSRTVCICNVHSIVTARRIPAHADAIRSADLVTPDGAPVAWMLRTKGHRDQERINGPDLMWMCSQKASELGTEMFLYGGYPSHPPISRTTTSRGIPEYQGRRLLFTPISRSVGSRGRSYRGQDQSIWRTNPLGGLGCPKQEAWMHAHYDRVKAVMVGVGAAFDFHAGLVKRAPRWMRRNGLEWLHRALHNPRRLAMRYLVTNSIFIMVMMRDPLLLRRQLRDG
jgi:N-acetylglucosaminyldiphosphoundecaprenol N-acetyl-beta-D-mannosaminyltransferase